MYNENHKTLLREIKEEWNIESALYRMEIVVNPV